MLKKVLMITTLSFAAVSAANAVTVDFETLNFGDIVTGQTINGATFSVANQGNTGGVPRELMVFDATCGGAASGCSGQDRDLFLPEAGNVLIISEDNDSSDPDDSRFGGNIFVDFENPVTLLSSVILDVEGSGNFVAAILGGTEVARVSVSSPNGGFDTAMFNSVIADQLLIHFETSGAIGELKFTPVPLPAALPLLLSGLGFFAFLRRRKQV